MDKKSIWERISLRTFVPPAVLLVLTVIIAFVIPQQFGAAMKGALNWVELNFGWFFVLMTTLFVGVLLWLAFSKYGNIRFGGKDAKPDMPTWKWFCVVLTSGMAAGLCYYGVAEPLDFFLNPPGFSGVAGGSPQAAELSLRYVFMHWGLHPYAIYTMGGLAAGFLYWNCKRRFHVSTGLIPLIGEKANGKLADWINGLCIFGFIAGFSTAIGLSSDQIATGFLYVTGLDINKNILYVIICLIFAVPSILAACSGLHKGIAKVSTFNMWIYFILMAGGLLLGKNLIFILNNTVSSVGQYFQFLPGQSLYTEAAQQTGWVNGWTIFYWAWWLSVCPLVGLFQTKMAKGRTVREFILVNMVAPLLFVIAWFGIFGSSAIEMVLHGNTSIPEVYNELGSSIVFFAWAKELPGSVIWYILGFLAIIFSVITLFEAQVLTLSDMCTKGVELDDTSKDETKRSPIPLKVFWGLLFVSMGFALLYSQGGLSAVQTTSVVLGLPILILTSLLMISAIKVFTQYKKYDKTLGKDEDYF
ncbi:hypothetical protein C3B58_00085 [Lactonifactor longoviformis]|uniref:Glycine betaine transporter n=1 Tax=Lactonifactor longoviformis DSM 17459 TaxID=1122155 RepID=A0A1M4Z1H1_9CLOT|nr:BCCT family transporter [Lactonifactor longoviformis]POP35026.1 hypothetical protein C3B58_00085 [Lactonifactor longoviformis]SHF11815.1 glycine betaine transporter [Lactonifactor longoviformis DSM 17459]